MKTIFVILITCTTCSAYAQNMNFSQFHAAPLTLNPASAGLGEGKSRLVANFRHTSIGNVTPFITGQFSYDGAVLRSKMKEYDRFGLGITATNDQSNGGGLKTNMVAITAAYNKALDANGNSSIGLGFQAQYVNRRIDYSRLSFEDQFASGGFDISAGSGDMSGANANRSYFDVNVGLMYRLKLNRFKGYAGILGGNLTKAGENFYEYESGSDRHFAVHAGGTLTINEDADIIGHAQYQERGNANMESVLFAYGRTVPSVNNDDIKIYAGAGMRVKDAIYPYLAMKFNGLNVGVSYDVSWPEIKTGSISRRSIEFSAIYNLGYR